MKELINKKMTISSREVAKMMDKEHKNLIRDIEKHTKILEKVTELNFELSDLWQVSSYKDSTGRTLKEYQVTKKGCEFLAHKTTGEKGDLFTIKYMNRFEAMEKALKSPSYMIEDPIKRAEAWIEEQKEKRRIEQERNLLQIELDESKDYYSIKRVAFLNNISWKTLDWRKLKHESNYQERDIVKIFDANYGEVNTYHRSVWEVVYPNLVLE